MRVSENLRRSSLGSVVGLLWISGSACGPQPVVEEAPIVRPIKVVTVGDTGTRTLEYPGEISASLQADLAFEVGGRMIDFPVEEGQEVRQGQLLARVDPRDYEAQRNAELASRNAAQSEYDRFESLLEKNAVAVRDFEAMQRALEVSEARLAISEKAVEDTNLRAPIRGRIARKLVDDHQAVQPKQPVLVLQDISALELVVYVPEQDIVGSQGIRGLDATVREVALLEPRVVVSALADRDFAAQLKEISTAADPVTRTFRVTFTFEPPDDAVVLPGMTARLALHNSGAGEPDERLAIPSGATFADDFGRAMVWKIDPSTMIVSRTSVELGELTAGSVEVLSGLARGDQIAASGVHHLRDGMQIRRLDG